MKMRKKKVLVVEDEKKIRTLLALYLEKNNYKVITAKNGQEAIEQVEQHLPTLVVLDIMMPVMNGLKVCQVLRKDRRYKQIPVLYLSSLTDKQSIISSLEQGGDDYVTKQFDRNEVVARINAILSRIKGNDFPSGPEDSYEELTYSAKNILRYIEKGYTNNEIALKLSLTEGTVKVYNHTIYQKLHVRNRTQAIVRAKELAIIK